MTGDEHACATSSPESLGHHWGRGDFSAAEASELRMRLARRSGGATAAVLALLVERGDAPTRAAASEALEAVRALPSAARIALLTHATCAFETSRLVNLIARFDRSAAPVAAADRLRRHYMRIVRGAAVAAGIEVEWKPRDRELLPIVGLSIEDAGGALCRIAPDDGGIVVESEAGARRVGLAQAAPGVRIAVGRAEGVEALPSFAIGPHRIHVDMTDAAFTEGWIERAAFGEVRVTAAASEDLPEWLDRLESAARLVERILPTTAEMLGLCVRSFVPVVSSDPATACSESDSSLPGAIMSTIDGPAVLAESIVHEFRHNLLHQLELSYPLYEAGSPQEARFYSPWRPDPRPLHGILHALFVFLDVCAIHAGVREYGLGTAHDLHDSAVRLAMNVERIGIAIEEFRAHAILTPFGHGFCAGIEAAYGRFAPLVAGLPEAARSQARTTVADHRASWKRP